MFYLFDQNNSYGRYDTTDTVCGRVVVEANSQSQAIRKAEELGCYWNGVEDGIDCPCCGNRWSKICDNIDEDILQGNGWTVEVFDGYYTDTAAEWLRRYGKHKIVEEPHYEPRIFEPEKRTYIGKIALTNVVEYVQFLADEYPKNTIPSARIFYKDGTVREINRTTGESNG